MPPYLVLPIPPELSGACSFNLDEQPEPVPSQAAQTEREGEGEGEGEDGEMETKPVTRSAKADTAMYRKT